MLCKFLLASEILVVMRVTPCFHQLRIKDKTNKPSLFGKYSIVQIYSLLSFVCENIIYMRLGRGSFCLFFQLENLRRHHSTCTT